MKKISWWMGALLALLGLLVIIFPAFWVKLVVVLLGIGAMAYGIYNLVFIIDLFENQIYRTTLLVKSILSIIIGALAVFLPLAFAGAMWTIMINILMVYLFLAGIAGFISLAFIKESQIDRKRFIMENVIILLVAIILLLISPEKLGKGIIRLIGVIALVLGCATVFLILKFEKTENIEATVITEESTKTEESENEEN